MDSTLDWTGRDRRGGTAAIFLVVALSALSASYLYLTQSVRNCYPDHGDRYSDAWTILAARNLDRFGFRNLMFFGTCDGGPEVGLPPVIWWHHPSFPAVVLGLQFRLGLSPSAARLLPLIAAHTALVAIFLIGRALTRDWRVGLAAAMAMAVAAPFRFQADGFAYISYDIAFKAWCWLLIVHACRSEGPRRGAWSVCAGLGAFVTIACSGFETVPAVALFAAVGSFLLLQPGWRRKCAASFVIAGCVAAGFVAGMVARVVHNSFAVGSVRLVIQEYYATLIWRAAPATADQWHNRSWPRELVHRLFAYYSLQLAFLAAGLVLLAAATLARRRRPAWTTVGVAALFFCCDAIWTLLMRQHSWIHTHTVTHLCGSLSLACGLVAVSLWDAIRRTWVKAVYVCAVAALSWAALGNVSVRPYGNNEAYAEPGHFIDTFRELTRDVPDNAIVECGNAMGPTPLLYLNRTFVWRSPVGQLDPGARPLYFLTSTWMPTGDEPYPEARFEKERVAKVGEFQVFRLVSRR
jgi:hypothetical protein